ncbi:hypothetical protein RHMOL_Rhmol03G0195400 [Rhododendron molle]|uniref:Uncharacterized protein n=1 Tax=Rhododendron molle TaxID=49168 RepID=A0ACC0PIR9_RHOML|nr:hypothetical protein RHMOL_Rhmol03G0195400 [Rhododendron molle]
MAALIRQQTSNLRLWTNHRRFHTSTAPLIKDTGLYGFDHLKTANGFRHFVDEAIERSGELVNYVSGMPSSTEIIRAMDEISDTVCSVVDSAELCRHTHPDREFVEEANKASLRINEYIHYLNTNHALYKAVIKAEKDGRSISEEAQRAAHSLRIDFEKGGIHLGADKLERVNQLQIDSSHLCREFNENITTDPGYVDIFPASRIPKLLHHLVKPIYRSTSSASGELSKSRGSMKEKGFRIITEPSTLSSVLQWASDSEVRKMAYVQGNSVPSANIGVLDKLIATRHEIAQIMGYKSYSEFAVHPNMASSPEVVMSFLLEMSEMVRPVADKVVASYFPLPQCIEGLKVLVKLLFGMTFQSVPLAPGESWHPDVLKMSLYHPEEGDLGYLYLDLNSRTGKYPGCAHFAIKGGRRISDSEYQLPVVALVCNFAGSRNSATVRINHWEVETLFHEFGHALHSLLSRTDYQHFSGTRVAIDLAETPSNLFEYFAWDYRVLKTFARHYSTGEIIPEKLVESMRGAKKMFAATELQRQVFYAIMDQTLFGEQPSSPIDTIATVANLKRQHTSWKHVEGTHWHTRFNHLLNYGAGYYSYLYAKCFAATIWEKMFQDDPLSPATGSAFRRRFLQHGGAKDPAFLLKDLVGDDILRYRDGGIVPDTTSLYCEMGLVED